MTRASMRPEALSIAFATPEYVTEKYFDGGLANYTHRVAKALAGRGHNIHVLTLSEIDQAEFAHEGVTVHRITLGKTCRRLNRLTHNRLTTTTQWLAFSVQVYRKLKQLNARQPLQLVQFPNWSCCGLVSSLFLRVPHVLRASSYQPVWRELSGAARTLDMRAVEWLERLQFRLSRYVYAPSHTLQQMLTRDAHVPHVRVLRPPFYLETQHWDHSIYEQFLQGKKYLLFFGRFQLHKGFHVLAQALPRVLAQHPDCYAVLVGRDVGSALAPSMADYARAHCADFGARLILLAELPHAQLYPVIAGAHLVVLPSLVENLPNACLEAMALARPVIGTLGTSFDELISDETNGFLIPPDNVAALTEKIISAWTHPRLHAIGQAAQQKILASPPEQAVESLLTFYQEIMHSWSKAVP